MLWLVTGPQVRLGFSKVPSRVHASWLPRAATALGHHTESLWLTQPLQVLGRGLPRSGHTHLKEPLQSTEQTLPRWGRVGEWHSPVLGMRKEGGMGTGCARVGTDMGVPPERQGQAAPPLSALPWWGCCTHVCLLLCQPHTGPKPQGSSCCKEPPPQCATAFSGREGADKVFVSRIRQGKLFVLQHLLLPLQT